MKFTEASKEAQVILLGSALAGVIEVFGRDADDGGRKLLITALNQIGLTPDEFKALINNMTISVRAEVGAVRVLEADPDDDFEEDAEDFGACAECARPVEDCVCDDEDDDLETSEQRPGNLNDDGRTDENGWQNLDEDGVCRNCHQQVCECRGY